MSKARLQAGSVSYDYPQGKVAWFAMPSPPLGWLKANGDLVSRTLYSALFAVIGTTFGEGDGSTTFKLPDLRGEFPRGWDDGRGVDADRVFGSTQEDCFEAHDHNLLMAKARDASISADNYNRAGAASSSEYLGSSRSPVENEGGTETRPRNIALLACIKY